MSYQKIDLSFDGYWRLNNVGGVPKGSGVYTVLTCTYNESSNTVSLDRLIYVGESEDVNARLANHEKLPDWKRYLRTGQELCFAVASVGGAQRERAEAAVIHHHKPPVNTQHKDSFPYDTTAITTSGRNAGLAASFVVEKPVQRAAW